MEPIDDIPIDGEQVPPVLDLVARDFIEHGFDLKRLFATLAATRAFQLDSRSPDPTRPVTAAQEAHWAAFPMTRLRPEQVGGSLMQSTYLGTLDAESPFLLRLAKFTQTQEFVKRFGDLGEGEFEAAGGTVPQRLLMMNGKFIQERTGPNPLVGAPTRIAGLSADPNTAVEAAYLCVLTRRPSEAEKDHFAARFDKGKNAAHQRAIEDLFWTLLNSTEFIWNH